MNKGPMNELMEFMAAVANIAGQNIMEYYGKNVVFHQKDDDRKSAQCIADTSTSELVSKILSSTHSSDAILDEENPDDKDRCNYKRVWIVDPLDSTLNFKENGKDFSFMMGYVIDQKARAGVIYQPYHDMMLLGDTEYGTAIIVQGIPLGRMPVLPIDKSEIMVGHTKNYKGNKYNKLFKNMGLKREQIVRSAGMGSRLMQLSQEHFNTMIVLSNNLPEWDYVAGVAPLQALGFQVTDAHGEELLFNKYDAVSSKGVVLANPGTHGFTIDMMLKEPGVQDNTFVI